MMYPAAVIIVAVLIVTGIMYFSIPKFQEIFADFGVELPLLTLKLIDTSNWVAGNYPTKGAMMLPGAVYIVLAPFIIYPLIKLSRKASYGKAATDYAILFTPIVGKIIRKTTIARFTRTLGTLVAAGVPILEAIRITSETSGNYVFEKALMKVHDSVRQVIRPENLARAFGLGVDADAGMAGMVQIQLLTWIFLMRVLMIGTSIVSSPAPPITTL